jgi:hypothetical protein
LERGKLITVAVVRKAPQEVREGHFSTQTVNKRKDGN